MTSKYPFPEERSLATRLIMGGALVAVLAFITTLVWKAAYPPEPDTATLDRLRSEIYWYLDLKLEDALPHMGEGEPLADLPPEAGPIVAALQAHAETLVADGRSNYTAYWDADDTYPPGVFVDAYFACNTDRWVYCEVSTMAHKRSTDACGRAERSNRIVFQTINGPSWAITAACLWWVDDAEQTSITDNFAADWSSVVDNLGEAPTRSADLDAIAARYSLAVIEDGNQRRALEAAEDEARRATGDDRIVVTFAWVKGVDRISDTSLSDRARQQLSQASAGAADAPMFGFSSVLDHNDFFVAAIWTWSSPD